MQRRFFQRSLLALVRFAALLLLLLSATPVSHAQRLEDPVYKNPLTLQTASRLTIENCADPSVIRGQTPGDLRWYLFCSSGPFGDADLDINGKLVGHTLPIFASLDLVNWSFVGDAVGARPAWARTATLSAPDVQFFNSRYYLYYTVATTDTLSSTIGVATSSTPTGPWTASSAPVIDPRVVPQQGTLNTNVANPAVLLDDNGQRYIYYTNVLGGIAGRSLSVDGLKADPTTETQLTLGARYERASVIKRNGSYYLLASTPDCCRGPLAGANIFAGRADRPMGPFVDQEGLSLMSGRVGGTPVISANGNRWVGPSHGKVITDLQGQTWLVYQAVDNTQPYFSREPSATKYAALLDQLDWIDGWPTVRAGRWASDTPTPMPAAKSGDVAADPQSPPRAERLDAAITSLSDEFNGAALNPQWTWVRQPVASSYGIISGTLRLDTQPTTLIQDINTAAVLTEFAPSDSYVVETRVRLSVPPEGCCYNAVQAGLVIYGDDDNYLKLTHTAAASTRLIEFAKELAPVVPGYPRYGSMAVGTPGEWTYLRILRRVVGSEDSYTAYTSRDGANWVRGGTWTHKLGPFARIGLVAMGGVGYVANFDYVRVYQFKATMTSPTSSSDSQLFDVPQAEPLIDIR